MIKYESEFIFIFLMIKCCATGFVVQGFSH